MSLTDPALADLVSTLVNNGFLKAGELGVLAQTSRKLNEVIVQDSIWQVLCNAEWEGTNLLPNETKKILGYRRLYREWCYNPPGEQEGDFRYKCASTLDESSPSTILEPPSCTPADVDLIIHVFYEGMSVLCATISGGAMRKFLRVGCVSCVAKDPINICKAVWDESERNVSFGGLMAIRPMHMNQDSFKATMHCHRYTDHSLCCIFSSSKGKIAEDCITGLCAPLLKDDGSLDPDAGFDLSKHQMYPLRYQFKNVVRMKLKDTGQGNEIWRQLEGSPLGLELEICTPVVTDGYLSVKGVDVYVKHRKRVSSSLFCDVHGSVNLLHVLSEIDTAETRDDHLPCLPKDRKRKRI